MSKTTVKDPWCQLAGGYKCFLENPGVSLPYREIVREVIPQAAMKICRFGGQIRQFYSLAQHMCGVSNWVEANGGTVAQQLQALLHDGAECILGGDLPKPVREKIFGYDELENRFIRHIMGLYELPKEIEDLVWDGDVALLVVEAETFLEGGPLDKWTERHVKPDMSRSNIIYDAFEFQGTQVPLWTPESAFRVYAEKLDRLTRAHLKNQLEAAQAHYLQS